MNVQAPGIFDVEAALVPRKYRVSQGIAFDAWFLTLSPPELRRRLDILLGSGTAVGYDISNDPKTHVKVLALRGETEKAIKVALRDLFSQPVAANLGWQVDFEQAQFADVVADTRVQAAMQRWEDEERVLRDDVRSYFATLDSGQ